MVDEVAKAKPTETKLKQVTKMLDYLYTEHVERNYDELEVDPDDRKNPDSILTGVTVVAYKKFIGVVTQLIKGVEDTHTEKLTYLSEKVLYSCLVQPSFLTESTHLLTTIFLKSIPTHFRPSSLHILHQISSLTTPFHSPNHSNYS